MIVRVAAPAGAARRNRCWPGRPRPPILVTNAGGSPGHVFGPIAGILRVVIDRIEAGDLTPVIDRTYPLADTAAGLRYLEEGHARGKVVVTVT
jgi:hypothetical protein